MDWFKCAAPASGRPTSADPTSPLPAPLAPDTPPSASTLSADAEPADETLVTATVSEPGDPALDIPLFLQRNRDNTFKVPPIHATPAGPVMGAGQPSRDDLRTEPVEWCGSPERRALHLWSDAELSAASASDKLSLVERQPIYQEQRRREDKKKSRDRIEKLLTKKSEGDMKGGIHYPPK